MISCIVAVAQNGVIGYNGEIPWYSSTDFKYFKMVTMGHPIIMGRNCFESIGRTLPGRLNIIITRDPFYVVSGAVVVHSIDEAIEIAHNETDGEIFIIGGGEIYHQTKSIWDRIYYTEIHAQPAGDTFFPKVDKTLWRLIEERHCPKGIKDDYACTFKIYDRVTFEN